MFQIIARVPAHVPTRVLELPDGTELLLTPGRRLTLEGDATYEQCVRIQLEGLAYPHTVQPLPLEPDPVPAALPAVHVVEEEPAAPRTLADVVPNHEQLTNAKLLDELERIGVPFPGEAHDIRGRDELRDFLAEWVQ